MNCVLVSEANDGMHIWVSTCATLVHEGVVSASKQARITVLSNGMLAPKMRSIA